MWTWPAFSTFNGPAARFLLDENYRMSMNGYRFGMDFRFLPRTTISYDQILEYDKDDTTDTLAFNNVLSLAPGTVPGPVDYGIEWFYPRKEEPPMHAGAPTQRFR